MSGGVDSSVATARLVDAGHEVVGVHLALSRQANAAPGSRGCCTLDDARDARRVADMLGIAFYVWDLSEAFRAEVVDDFLDEYRAGRTPNPCLRCNERIKFSAVLDRALALDFDAVATGHYARIVEGPSGAELHRAVDASKDQSYVLGVLDASQVARSMFPLGDSLKDDVRAEARDRGLLTASKPDSHDICFIPDGNTAAFLQARLGANPGDIVDAVTGARLGEHSGACAFTIGQRRGLGLKVPAADGDPRYVVDVDITSNTVRLGRAQLLDVHRAVAIRPRWAGPALPVGPAHAANVDAQFRAHGEALPARAWREGDRVVVELERPIRGLAPGQAVVLFEGTRVMGSATVDSTDALDALRGT